MYANDNLDNLVPAIPLVNRGASDTGLFRYGNAKPVETDGGRGNFALGPAQRSTFSMARTMSSYGNGNNSDGNDGTLTVNGVIPVGLAYDVPLTFTAGPGYGSPGYDPTKAVLGGGYLQSSLKTPLFVNLVQRRESEYIPNRGDGNAALVFNDGVGIQTTASLEGTDYGRIYGGHYNVTLQKGFEAQEGIEGQADAKGQAICLEMELNNASKDYGQDIFSHRQKVNLQLVARGGDVTKAISFVADGGGKFHTLLYVNAGSMMPAKQTPTTGLDSGVEDIGGSFLRYAETQSGANVDIYREAPIDGFMVRANGHGKPRHSKYVVEHVKRPDQITNIWEIPSAGGSGQIWQEYVVTGGNTGSFGYDRGTGEFRFTSASGLGSSLRASISANHVALFASASTSLLGGTNNLFLAEGTAAQAVNNGCSFFSLAGVPRVVRGDGVTGTINVTWAS